MASTLNYTDLDDLESAIRFYVREYGQLRPGQDGGFAREVNHFVATWSRESCYLFVEAIEAHEQSKSGADLESFYGLAA